MQHVDFHWQSANGLQLYAQGWEPETAPAAVVCLVHGLGEHSGRYAHVAAALTAAGYALLGFDLRGHGKSEGKRGHAASYDALLDDIGRLLDEAAARHPDKPRFLYGHSLGGNLVLDYALRRCSGQALRHKPALSGEERSRRVAGVIATSPAIRTATPPPAWKITLGKIMYKIQPGMQMANGLDRDGLARDPEVVRAYASDPLVHDRISARLALDMLQAGEWALAHAAEFPLPLLLMHGTADRLTSPKASQEFAAQAPGDVTLKLWEGLYHETHNEPEKAQVLAFMIDWLDTLALRTRSY